MIASILIPTYRRTKLLAQAVNSCLNQQNIRPEDYEIVVVDNCPNRSAELVVGDFTRARTAVLYIHEPKQGVVFARNKAISVARGDYVVFLDDDECATQNWLSELLRVRSSRDADVVFGPIREIVDEKMKAKREAFDFSIVGRNFKHVDGDDISERLFDLGTGNSLFTKARCFGTANPFDQRFNFCGGEDIDLLSRMVDSRRRFVWAAHAWVDEHVSTERLATRYLMKRRFHAGQVRTIIEARRTGRAPILQMAFWMTVGSAQICYYSFGFILALLRRRDPSNYAARIAGGAGKLLFSRYPKSSPAN